MSSELFAQKTYEDTRKEYVSLQIPVRYRRPVQLPSKCTNFDDKVALLKEKMREEDRKILGEDYLRLDEF